MIKGYLFIILIYAIIGNSLFSQNLSGIVKNQNNEPLNGATVYIQETNQALICNEQGEYRASLLPGRYTLEYRYWGFKNQILQIEIKNQDIVQDIDLQNNNFTLTEAMVTNKKTYAEKIMQNVIRKAPFYLYATQEYIADVYINTEMKWLKIPKIISKIASEKGYQISDYKGQAFIQESYNEIRFTTPDKYEQTIKAFSSSLPGNYDPKDAFGIMTASLYAPMYQSNISPLNPKSFNYYTFRYEGQSEDSEQLIHKIAFDAKHEDPALMNGYLYIADSDWSLVSADISSKSFGVKQKYQIMFENIGQNISLPISYSLKSTINALGVKAFFNYSSSLKYTSIKPADNIAKQIEIFSKQKRELEIKPNSLHKITTDSMALKRDSVFWEKVRTFPLNKNEKTNFLITNPTQRIGRKQKFNLSDLILGGQIGNDTTRLSIKYDGLLLTIPEYNFVDGAWIGQRLRIKTRFAKHNPFLISPYAYYTTGRKELIYGSNIELGYAPIRTGKISLSAGVISEDFNPNGITRFDNFISSAMYRESDNYFYLKNFISIHNQIDLSNGLNLNTEVEIAKRQGTTNHSSWGISGNPNKIKPNIFSTDRFDATSYSIALSYSPRAHYFIQNGKKKYGEITSPTFTFEYKEGFSSWRTNNLMYKMLRGEIKQTIQTDYFSKIDYRLEGGVFMGNKNTIHFTDYKHFDTSDMFSTSKWPYDTFVLLDNYAASTNKNWIQGFVNYRSRYLLLKRIPLIQRLSALSENIHLKSVYTPHYGIHTEVGYSLDLMRLFNVGIHTSFRDGKHERTGIRLSYILRDILKAL